MKRIEIEDATETKAEGTTEIDHMTEDDSPIGEMDNMIEGEAKKEEEEEDCEDEELADFAEESVLNAALVSPPATQPCTRLQGGSVMTATQPSRLQPSGLQGGSAQKARQIDVQPSFAKASCVPQHGYQDKHGRRPPAREKIIAFFFRF